MERVVARLGTYLRRHDDYDKYVSSTVACAPPGQDSGPVHAEVLTPPARTPCDAECPRLPPRCRTTVWRARAATRFVPFEPSLRFRQTRLRHSG